MVNALKTAVEKVKELSVSRQEYAAHVLEHIAESASTHRIPQEHRIAVLQGLNQAKQRKFVSNASIKKILRRQWT
ncbi:MAG: hypothetical protein AAB798_00790 [Patescibacteria group bacterium]